MGRQVKQGLDYFTVDVDFFDSIKIRKIRKACGNQSIALLIALLCNIYRENGYYVGYDSDLTFLIAEQFSVSEGAVEEAVRKAVSVGFFDTDMFNKYNILTSHSIQERYFIAVDKLKRKRVAVIGDFVLKSIIECGYIDKLGGNAVFHRDKSNKSLNKSDYVKVKVKGKVKEKVNVNVNKSIVEKDEQQAESKTENEQTNNTYSEVIEYLNMKAQTRYKASTPKTKQLIHARLSEGFILDDFKIVIDNKCADWKGTEFEKFLRPETLFGTKFEGYLNARQTVQKSTNKNVEMYERALAKARDLNERSRL